MHRAGTFDMLNKVVWGGAVRLALVGITLGAVSCGDAVRQGTGTSYLIINALEGSSGAEDKFSTTLQSDVLTMVDDGTGTRVPTVFSDQGRVTLTLGLKDPGSAASPTTPAQPQFITIDRYHVQFRRADGRNTQGVDVPYAFDSAITLTVGGGTSSGGFTLVRHTAKGEAPLATLARSSVILATIADVTFYGHDQTGREVSVTGSIGIDFGNFADPQ